MSDIINADSKYNAADPANFETAAFETATIKPIGTERGDLLAKSIAELLGVAATSTGGEPLAFVNVLYREWFDVEGDPNRGSKLGSFLTDSTSLGVQFGGSSKAPPRF